MHSSSINMLKNIVDNYLVTEVIKRILKRIHIFSETEVQGGKGSTFMVCMGLYNVCKINHNGM